jgi:hypothetical protein
MSILALHAATALNELVARITAETSALSRKLETVPDHVRMLSSSVLAQASTGYVARSEGMLSLIRRDALQLRTHADVTASVLRSARDAASIAAGCTKAVTELLAHEVQETGLSPQSASLLIWALWEQDAQVSSEEAFNLGARFASFNDVRAFLDNRSSAAACCYGFEHPRMLTRLLSQNPSVPIAELREAAVRCAA